MKKQIIFLVLSVVLSGHLVFAQSQRTTYISEPFNDGWIYKNWDTAATFPLVENILYTLDDHVAGGKAPEVLFGHATSMGVRNQPKGTVGFISKPSTMMSGTPYVTFKYYYQSVKQSTRAERSFGVAARLKNEADWTECGVMDSLPTELGPTVFSAALPERFHGQSGVQIFVFLQNADTIREFLYVIDDIEFFSLPDGLYGGALEMTSPNNLSAETAAVDLTLTNIGHPMEKCKISYQLGQDAVQEKVIQFEEPIVPNATYVIEDLALGNLKAGTVDFQVWVSEVNGTAVADIKKSSYSLNIVEASDMFDRKLLVESFTSATCPPCATLNRRLNPAFDSLENDIALVKYQMNWPGSGDKYYNRNGGVRRDFYGVTSVPSMFINGKPYPLASSLTTASYLRDVRAVMAGNDRTFFNIVIEKAHIDPKTNILELSYRIDSKGILPHATIETAVIEKTTFKNKGSNGEKVFHHVMMAMAPGSTVSQNKTGVSLDVKKDTAYAFNYTVEMGTTKMEESGDLQVVCFIQGENGEVWQAATMDVTGGVLANEAQVACTPLFVYPNPATEEVYLHGLDAATVEVFDLTGRRMSLTTDVNGDFTLDVRNYTPGIYVIKTYEGDKVSQAKVSVVK